VTPLPYWHGFQTILFVGFQFLSNFLKNISLLGMVNCDEAVVLLVLNDARMLMTLLFTWHWQFPLQAPHPAERLLRS